MKLVKKGTKRDKKWKATCPNCGSKFEAKESELNVVNDRDGSLARSKCTVCKSQMFFYAGDGSSSRSGYPEER